MKTLLNAIGASMKINIPEWAKVNGMTPEQFKNEIAETMATVGAMELEAKGDESDMVVWTIRDEAGPIQVIVRRVGV